MARTTLTWHAPPQHGRCVAFISADDYRYLHSQCHRDGLDLEQVEGTPRPQNPNANPSLDLDQVEATPRPQNPNAHPNTAHTQRLIKQIPNKANP
eukprot:630351-Prymnesium_polylepis.1